MTQKLSKRSRDTKGYEAIEMEGTSADASCREPFGESHSVDPLEAGCPLCGSQGKGEGDSWWTRLALVHMSSMEVASSP
jgi:hypothetical protein